MNSPASRTALSVFVLCTATGLLAATPCAAQTYGGSNSTSSSTSAAPSRPAHSSSSSSKDHLSKSVGPSIMDAQKALQANDYQGAMAKLKEAQAISDRTDFDNFIIARLMMSAAIGLKDMATATTAVEAAADSPAMADASDDDRKAILHNAVLLSRNASQWNKTIAYGQQLAALNGLDSQTAACVALAYYEGNDFAHAQQFAQQSMAYAKAAGQPSDPQALQIVMSSQVKQNNQAGAEQTLEQLVLQSNASETWAQIIGVAFGAKGMDDEIAIYLYRLLVLTGAAKGSDYKEMANALSVHGYPTEAANVLQQGIAAGKLSSGEAGATLAKARRDAAQDQRMLPQIAAAAAKSRTGEQDIKLAEDYWGYGRYADAEAAARRAVAKGGLKRPAEGPLMIGAADAAQGKYADAIQVLSQVSGNEAATRTAHLWSLYAQARQGGRTAAAPAAPAH